MAREPYLTFCLMSVNGGGWTLFYKNNNLEAEGESYASLLVDAKGFITQGSDISSTTVVGVSPVDGLEPVAILSMPVDSTTNAFSVVNFDSVDIAESILLLTDLVEGENSYDVSMTFSETLF